MYIAIMGCKACGACRDVCERDAIIFEGERAVKIDYEKCNLCMKCVEVCTNGALICID
ncbi:MAG: ferredoxin [Archaeoglobus sp.]|jgi:ferredoxin|nr:MAG: ferredoxin [Archaeoglobus sp.]